MAITYNLQNSMDLHKQFLHDIPVSATPNAIGALDDPFAKFKHQFCHLTSGDVQGGL